jgi:hypothetical protein
VDGDCTFLGGSVFLDCVRPLQARNLFVAANDLLIARIAHRIN